MQTAKCARLGVRDIAGVMQLERLCFRTRWTREQFLLGLERRAFRILGVRERRELVAYVAFSVIAGEMEILNIAVHPIQRRRGLATLMLAEVLDICRSEHVQQGFLEVRSSNASAIDLYRKFGFMQVGTRKNYYPDNNEDALLFRLDFPAVDKDAHEQHEPGPAAP